MMITKKIKRLAFLGSVLLIASCSKDREVMQEEFSQKDKVPATISFSAKLNGVNQTTGKTDGGIPTCSTEATAYINVVITGPENIGSIANPQRLDIADPTTMQTETLSVVPGDYELIYFVGYDVDDNLIWIAPSDSPLSQYVPEPLPIQLSIEANSDSVVNVDVLCFEDRELSQFGEVYFGLDSYKAIEFCVLGSTCDGATANYSVNVYSGTDNTGMPLFADLASLGGEAVCMPLPDLAGEDQYYFEISLNGTLVREGAITDTDVKALFVGDENLNPYRFYEGSACTTTDSPALFTVVTDGTDTGGGDTGGDTGGAFMDYIQDFESFDATATYDPSYLIGNGFEQYQLNTYTVDKNIDFEAEEANAYPSLADVSVTTTESTGTDGNGVQMTIFAENGTDSAGWSYGDFDVVMVSPGQADANGTFDISIDARRYFSETTGNVTWYWTNNYSPAEGFVETNWNALGTDDAQSLNQSGGFQRKEFTGINSTGTLYFAVRVEGSLTDGGTPDVAGDGQYRFRVRFDNLQIKNGL